MENKTKIFLNVQRQATEGEMPEFVHKSTY